jgi:hypothetical protein
MVRSYRSRARNTTGLQAQYARGRAAPWLIQTDGPGAIPPLSSLAKSLLLIINRSEIFLLSHIQLTTVY